METFNLQSLLAASHVGFIVDVFQGQAGLYRSDCSVVSVSLICRVKNFKEKPRKLLKIQEKKTIDVLAR